MSGLSVEKECDPLRVREGEKRGSLAPSAKGGGEERGSGVMEEKGRGIEGGMKGRPIQLKLLLWIHVPTTHHILPCCPIYS